MTLEELISKATFGRDICQKLPAYYPIGEHRRVVEKSARFAERETGAMRTGRSIATILVVLGTNSIKRVMIIKLRSRNFLAIFGKFYGEGLYSTKLISFLYIYHRNII